MRRTRASTTS